MIHLQPNPIKSNTTEMLDKEFKYYLSHQDELVKKFNGKYIAIVGDTVVGGYDSYEEAYFETQKKYELGSFLIQYCIPGTIAYTQTFYSQNVAF